VKAARVKAAQVVARTQGRAPGPSRRRSPSGVTPTVAVVGLGPGGPDLLAPAALAAFAAVEPAARFLRTARHPAASAIAGATTFDHVYDAAACMDEVYEAIAAAVLEGAAAHGRVVYGVPGSPLVAERTVELLRAAALAAGVEVELVPSLSFLDVAWARLGVDPLAAGVRLVDGHRFATEAAGERGPLLVAQCDSGFVLSSVKLAIEEPGDATVTILQRLGLPDEVVLEVPWAELDRAVVADHLTTLWIPHLAAPVAAEMEAFRATVRTLRERCPWDARQTHRSLLPYVVEEAGEVAEVLAVFDADDETTVEDLCEELGDLLFQVVLHATMAEQEGLFTLADVAAGIDEKLVRRHPHVFAGEPADEETIRRRWAEIKADEKAAKAQRRG